MYIGKVNLYSNNTSKRKKTKKRKKKAIIKPLINYISWYFRVIKFKRKYHHFRQNENKKMFFS